MAEGAVMEGRESRNAEVRAVYAEDYEPAGTGV